MFVVEEKNFFLHRVNSSRILSDHVFLIFIAGCVQAGSISWSSSFYTLCWNSYLHLFNSIPVSCGEDAFCLIVFFILIFVVKCIPFDVPESNISIETSASPVWI